MFHAARCTCNVSTCVHLHNCYTDLQIEARRKVSIYCSQITGQIHYHLTFPAIHALLKISAIVAHRHAAVVTYLDGPRTAVATRLLTSLAGQCNTAGTNEVPAADAVSAVVIAIAACDIRCSRGIAGHSHVQLQPFRQPIPFLQEEGRGGEREREKEGGVEKKVVGKGGVGWWRRGGVKTNVEADPGYEEHSHQARVRLLLSEI